MTSPLLTIVMATFNAEGGVESTISSITSQQGFDPKKVEVVMMDGASRDRTVTIAHQSRIFRAIVSRPDAGVYDAMNSGVAIAEGRWIQFLNAGDTFADRSSLAMILEALEHADASGRLWLVAGARNRSAGGAVIRNVPHNWVKHSLGLQPHCHQATFFRTSALAGIGSHSLEFGTAGDFDAVLRLGFAVGAPAQLSEVVIDYEGGGMSDVSPMETAMKLAEVRNVRFQLRGSLARFNLVLAWGIAQFNACRIQGGRLRRRFGA